MERRDRIVVEVHHAVGRGVHGGRPGRHVLYLAELAVHAWDLARATGQLDRLDPSLALPALDGARALIKPQYRNVLEPGAPFGAEVPSPPGADD
jgi:hypothetical protein